MRYKKTDIQMHGEGHGRNQYPAVNVKVYNVDYTVKDLAEELSCTIEEAERVATIAYESACEVFWEYNAADHVEYYFGKAAKYYSAGRSSGWLIVTGLDDIEKWDALMITKWACFERDIHAEVASLTSREQIIESIRSNEWVTPIAESGDALQAE